MPESVKEPKNSKVTSHKANTRRYVGCAHALSGKATRQGGVIGVYTPTYSIAAHRAISTLECMLAAEANRSCGVGVRPGNAGADRTLPAPEIIRQVEATPRW